MKKKLISLACFWIGLMSVNSQKQVEVKIDPGHVENRINDKIYGFLLEHLYHSVSNGERMFGIVVLKNCWLMVIGKSAVLEK